MQYDITSNKIKLESVIEDWILEHKKETLYQIIDIIDMMILDDDNLIVPIMINEGITDDYNTNLISIDIEDKRWVVCYTNDSQSVGIDELLLDVPIKLLFALVSEDETSEGIIINPNRPFLLSKEVIKMNWYERCKINSSFNISLNGVSDNIKLHLVKDKKYSNDLNITNDNNNISIKIPFKINSDDKVEELIKRINDLINYLINNDIHKVSLMIDDLGNDLDYEIMEYIFISISKLMRINSTYNLDLTFETSDNETYELLNKVLNLNTFDHLS